MIEMTTKIRALSLEEKNILLSELTVVPNHFWSDHMKFAKVTALRYGITCPIKWIDYDCNLVLDNFNYFNNTKNLLEQFNDKNLGRVYWHKLEPNKKIVKHNDYGAFATFANKFITRFQIYLDVPKNFSMIIDDKIVDDPITYSNSIYEFALQKNHYYENKSEEDFYILVFDFIND